MACSLSALAGFGLDSLIEIFASMVVLWQLAGLNALEVVALDLRRREQRALRLIGASFVALAAYVAAQVVVVLVVRHHADTSPGGIAWLALTVIAMLLLARAKRQTGEAAGNPVLVSEARVTLVDAWLAASVLTGVVLNAVAGWWWADPLSAAVIVYYGAREGAHAWREGRAMGVEASPP